MFTALVLLFLIIRTILKSEPYYTYIFAGIISLPLTYELYHYSIRQNEIKTQEAKEAWADQAEIKYEEIWQNSDKPKKALQLMEAIELPKKNKDIAQSNLDLHKTALYLLLGLKEDRYFQNFLMRYQKLETEHERERVAYFTLVYYKPKSDEEIQKIIKAFENYPESMLIVWRFFWFEKLVKQGFEESALMMLKKEKIKDKKAYINIANKMSSTVLRQKVTDYITLHH